MKAWRFSRIATACVVLGLVSKGIGLQAQDRKVFTNSVKPLPATAAVRACAATSRNETMDLLFTLDIPAEVKAELKRRQANQEVISPKELNERYSAPKAAHDALVEWLKGQGFTITKQSADRTRVWTKATVDAVAKALAVNMVRVTKNGVTYNAAQNAPSLPANVAANVHGISGLQPFRQANRHSIKPPSKQQPPNRGLVRHIANGPPFLVSEIKKAYGVGGNSPTGAGQKIAILIDTYPSNADIAKFWEKNHIPGDPNNIEQAPVEGVVASNLPPREGEETLDAEWSSGIAPGAKIRIYASGSLEFVDLERALGQIIDDLAGQQGQGLHQLSISLGLGETFMIKDDVDTMDDLFLRLSAAGVNIFVSSGDAGSHPDSTGHSSTGPLQAEYPASDPYVVAVGGTSLTLSPTGSVADETGWAGSGGGESIYFSRPAWQVGGGLPAGTQRLVPDVSLVADPQTGAYFVFDNDDTQAIGGTSWSAPVWAGLCALINEQRVSQSKAPLSQLNPRLYPLIGSTSSRDIVTGNNGTQADPRYAAGVGYDMVTGVGVPKLDALTQELLK
jgi:kumamolisin